MEKEKLIIKKEDLEKLIRSNISCHSGKIVSNDFVNEIAIQIIDSIVFFIKEGREK